MGRPLRFCMITTFYPPYHFGGDAVFVRALARALVRRGHKVEVVHCEDAYHLGKSSIPTPQTENDGVIVHRLKSRLGMLSPLITQQTGRPGLKSGKLETIFERNFDVVNFHNISLVGGPGVLGMSKAPVNLYTLHEHWLICPMHIFWKNRKQACDRPECIQCCLRSGVPPQLWRYTSLIQRSVAKVDALLSPSEHTARRHRDAGLTPHIHILPLFSNLNPPSVNYTPSIRPRFLYVGRVIASKGIPLLLEDFSRLKEYDLYIAGDGDLRLKLQNRYADCPNIHFLGMLPQEQLIQLYQSATAFVLPSLAPEVFPLSILEAFACGTPAIAHHAGGSREAIDKTGGGFVYESQSDFHKAIFVLAKDPQLRDTLGKLARRGYEQYYSEELYLSSYLDFVSSIRKQKGILN